MPSSKEYLSYVLDLLTEIENVSYKNYLVEFTTIDF